MSGTGDNMATRADEVVEALLEQASPRPAPPSDDEQLIREAVRAEWQAVTGKRTTLRRVSQFAIAATVLLAVAVTFNVFRTNGIAPVQVATISKSHGAIYLPGEDSERTELADLATISTGQTIVTGSGAGIGLEWTNGGSLRVDENTRIEFRSAESVYLSSGRIYFDSQPGELVTAISGGSGQDSVFVIETELGTVTHLGTQYMTYVGDEKLTVSVREGEVSISGVHHDGTAVEGQQMTLAGSGRPTVLDITSHGPEWKWIEDVAPVANVDGRSLPDFLDWVSRETGLRVEFATDAARRQADAAILRGNVDEMPMEALRFRMLTANLDWHVEGGKIVVSAIDAGSGP